MITDGSRREPLYLLLAFCALNSPLYAASADEAQERGRLEAVQGQMSALADQLRANRAQRVQIEAELRTVELAVSGLQTRIQDAERGVLALTRDLTRLQQQRQTLEQTYRRERDALGGQLAAAYRLGRQEPLKLVFNLEDPHSLGRTLRYYGYFLAARRDKLARYQNLLDALATNRAVIDAKQAELDAERRSLLQERSTLAARRDERSGLLVELDRQSQADGARLAQLTAERDALEAVLAAIEAERQRQLARERQRLRAAEVERRREAEAAERAAKTRADAQTAARGDDSPGIAADAATAPVDEAITPTEAPFRSQRGRLPWPARATVAHAFGAARAASLSWQGWLMVGAEGTPVRAIHPGTVVFADYLGGQGLLLIIDHGDGYLSLYAHNQALLKQVGDAVERGEMVARIGNTGGAGRSALYFEIRHGGEAIDPKPWLRSKA